MAGENLPVIQRTLNHSSLAATQVYARLSIGPMRRALDAQASRMLGEPQKQASAANENSACETKSYLLVLEIAMLLQQHFAQGSGTSVPSP